MRGDGHRSEPNIKATGSTMEGGACAHLGATRAQLHIEAPALVKSKLFSRAESTNRGLSEHLDPLFYRQAPEDVPPE